MTTALLDLPWTTFGNNMPKYAFTFFCWLSTFSFFLMFWVKSTNGTLMHSQTEIGDIYLDFGDLVPIRRTFFFSFVYLHFPSVPTWTALLCRKTGGWRGLNMHSNLERMRTVANIFSSFLYSNTSSVDWLWQKKTEPGPQPPSPDNMRYQPCTLTVTCLVLLKNKNKKMAMSTYTRLVGNMSWACQMCDSQKHEWLANQHWGWWPGVCFCSPSPCVEEHCITGT